MPLDDIFQWLQRLCLEPGVSGRESRVAALYIDAISSLADDYRIDPLGNVVAVKYGEQKGDDNRVKLMIAAHTDEIGMLVAGINKDGFLQVTPVGGVDRALLFAKPVVVHTTGGPLPGLITSRPPHLTTPKERETLPPWEEWFVDVGMSHAAVTERVQIGDMITMQGGCVRLAGNKAAGKAVDDRASVVAMIVMLQQLHKLRHHVDVYAVATVQEEVGLRGATTSTFGINPDVGIAVDVGFAKQPGVKPNQSHVQGKGPVIAKGANIHPHVYEGLAEAARQMNIQPDTEIVPANTGTDAWAIQVTRSGVPTGLLSIPLAHMHSTVETVDLTDIDLTGRLLAQYAAAADAEQIRGWQRVLA